LVRKWSVDQVFRKFILVSSDKFYKSQGFVVSDFSCQGYCDIPGTDQTYPNHMPKLQTKVHSCLRVKF